MSWRQIIVHHSATEDSAGVETSKFERAHRRRGWRRIGYHRIVEGVDGEFQVLMGRPAYMVGSHCKGWNASALGVCFVGNFQVQAMEAEQLERGAEAIAELCLAFSIGPEQIWAHRDCGATACPGERFPMGRLVSRVRELLTKAEV